MVGTLLLKKETSIVPIRNGLGEIDDNQLVSRRWYWIQVVIYGWMDDFFNIGTQSVVPWRGTDRFNIYRYVWHAIRQKQRRQQVSAGSRKPFLCNIRPFAISFVTGVFTLSAKNVVSPVVMIPLEWILNRIFLNEWTDRLQNIIRPTMRCESYIFWK